MTAGSLARLAGCLRSLALPIPVGIGHRLQLIEQAQHPQGAEVGGDRGAGLATLHIGHGEAAHAQPLGHILQPPAAAQPGGADVAPQPLQGLLQGRVRGRWRSHWHHRSERPNRPGWGVFRGSLPVPRSSALNTQTLIALGPECLAELLLELAGSDPAIKRRIRLAVANATSPYEAAAQVRQRLATIARSRSFLELGNNVLGRCDDSSGLLGDVFRQAMGQLGRITEAAQPDPPPGKSLPG